MNMNQKGFANIILIVVVVVAIVAVGGYFVFSKKSEPVSQTGNTTPTQTNNQNTNPTPVSKTYSESEILASLKTNWQSTQTLIPFRPSFHNQAEDLKKVWRTPDAVQFIGKGGVLVRFEDDNNAHVAVLKFDNGKFSLLEVFKNQGEFTLSDWQNLVNKYGDSSYSVSTYTTGLIRNKEIVNFTDLTKVSENIFVKNYFSQ